MSNWRRSSPLVLLFNVGLLAVGLMLLLTVELEGVAEATGWQRGRPVAPAPRRRVTLGGLLLLKAQYYCFAGCG